MKTDMNAVEEMKSYFCLIDECFCVNANGAMKDLMAEWQGEHNRNEADELVEALANELYSFNKGRFGSVTVHDFTMDGAVWRRERLPSSL